MNFNRNLSKSKQIKHEMDNNSKLLEEVENNILARNESILTIKGSPFYNFHIKKLPKLEQKDKKELNIVETNKIEFFPCLKRVSSEVKKEK